MTDNYISGTDVGKRIENFISRHCEVRLHSACKKSLWKILKERVPTQKSGSKYGTRYNYNEQQLGEVMYQWYDEEYPNIVARANKRSIAAKSNQNGNI